MYTNGVVQQFTLRKEEGRGARVLRFSRERAADVAQNLTRLGAYAMAAELCNEAVGKLIELCYQADDTGRVNVDQDGRLLIPAPWGRNGRYVFGLRSTEADVLRLHCFKLMGLINPPPLFVYEPLARAWYLNIHDYKTMGQAQDYWVRVGLDAGTYKQLAERVQHKRRRGT